MRKTASKFNRLSNKIRDIVVTDCLYLFPCACTWFYRKAVKKEILSYEISDGESGNASIFQHTAVTPGIKEVFATLILHGLHSHPFLMLHLADIAQESGEEPVFSLYLTYDQEDTGRNSRLIKQTVDFIEKAVRDSGNTLGGVVLVGHSMGAIEAAGRAFVDFDTRVISVISIAGRLGDPDALLGEEDRALKGLVNKIHEGILARPELPLYQIVGANDWNATLDSMIIRSDEGCFHVIEDASHFDILFHEETCKMVREFLKESILKVK